MPAPPLTRLCEGCNKELRDKKWFTCTQCPAEQGLQPVFCRDCIAGHEHEEDEDEDEEN